MKDMILSHQGVWLAWALLAANVSAAELSSATGSELQTLRVSVQTPNPCWTIKIDKVYSTDHELLVVSRLAPPVAGESCIQMVAQVEDEVSVEAPPRRVKHLILGRTWDARQDSSGWGPEADYVYLHSDGELSRMLKGAQPMFARHAQAADGPEEAAPQSVPQR